MLRKQRRPTVWLSVHGEGRTSWYGQAQRMVTLLYEVRTIVPMRLIAQRKGVALMCMKLKQPGRRFGRFRGQEW